jgi:hypothetical protein
MSEQRLWSDFVVSRDAFSLNLSPDNLRTQKAPTVVGALEPVPEF